MIVVDASIIAELLLNGAAASRIATRIASESLHAPELIELEVLQVVRRYRRTEQLPASRAREMVADLQMLRIELHSHSAFIQRIWDLHENLTACDASYVALAEALDSPLLTMDRRLARSGRHTATIEYCG